MAWMVEVSLWHRKEAMNFGQLLELIGLITLLIGVMVAEHTTGFDAGIIVTWFAIVMILLGNGCVVLTAARQWPRWKALRKGYRVDSTGTKKIKEACLDVLLFMYVFVICLGGILFFLVSLSHYHRTGEFF